MSRQLLVAIVAAAVLGAIGSAGIAKAMPLTPTTPSPAQFDRSTVVEVKQHKAKHHRNRPRVTFGVTVPGVVYPGVHQGIFHHPHVYIDVGAPHHCHKWTDQFGFRQKICHRHW